MFKSCEIFSLYLQFIHSPSVFIPLFYRHPFYSSLTLSALSPTLSLPLGLIHGVSVCPLSSAASRQTSQTFHSPLLHKPLFLLFTSLDPISSVVVMQRPGTVQNWSLATVGAQ